MYDPVHDFDRWFQIRLGELLRPVVANKATLDVGCAMGVMTEFLAESASRVDMLDGSETYIEAARHRFTRSNVRFFCSLFEEFEPDGAYDVVVCSHVLEHVIDPVDLLRRMKSWLAPDGVLIACVPNALSVHRMLGVDMGLVASPYELSERDVWAGTARLRRADVLARHSRSRPRARGVEGPAAQAVPELRHAGAGRGRRERVAPRRIVHSESRLRNLLRVSPGRRVRYLRLGAPLVPFVVAAIIVALKLPGDAQYVGTDVGFSFVSPARHVFDLTWYAWSWYGPGSIDLYNLSVAPFYFFVELFHVAQLSAVQISHAMEVLQFGGIGLGAYVLSAGVIGQERPRDVVASLCVGLFTMFSYFGAIVLLVPASLIGRRSSRGPA